MLELHDIATSRFCVFLPSVWIYFYILTLLLISFLRHLLDSTRCLKSAACIFAPVFFMDQWLYELETDQTLFAQISILREAEEESNPFGLNFWSRFQLLECTYANCCLQQKNKNICVALLKSLLGLQKFCAFEGIFDYSWKISSNLPWKTKICLYTFNAPSYSSLKLTAAELQKLWLQHIPKDVLKGAT